MLDASNIIEYVYLDKYSPKGILLPVCVWSVSYRPLLLVGVGGNLKTGLKTIKFIEVAQNENKNSIK